MLAAKIVFVPLMFLSLAKLTKQAKEEDCVKGKQYWSEESFIPGEDGVCIACPPNWLTCYDQLIGKDNRKRCVDSCRAEPKPSSSPKVPLTPTPSFILPEVIPSLPTSVVQNPDVKKEEKELSGGNEDENTGLIIAVSTLVVFTIIACSVALVLVIRKIQRRSASCRNNGDEDMNLQEIETNDEEDHLHEQNNGEQRHDDEVLPASDSENLSAAETAGPVQATPSAERYICGIKETEDGNFPSSFNLHQVET